MNRVWTFTILACSFYLKNSVFNEKVTKDQSNLFITDLPCRVHPLIHTARINLFYYCRQNMKVTIKSEYPDQDLVFLFIACLNIFTE